MSENESFTLTDILVYPYIALVIAVAMLFLISHFSRKLRKYVKFYICFDSERVMEDGVPFKAFLYIDGCKTEIRRFGMDKAVCGKIKPLMGKLREVFPKLKSKNFSVSWKDEDDDEVLMSSNEEVETMYHQSHEAVLKLIVRCLGPKTDDEIPETTAVTDNPARIVNHHGITCDGCNRPVVGFRYKCITCDDFDLCTRCENNGLHPEHCVVRVPMPNLALPLIKATIKKSRRFLKSVASQAHEENKRLRRERGVIKLATDGGATNPGKQAPQPGASRNWVSIFGSYLEEFANLAGDISRHAQEKLSPEVTKPAESAANESSNVPSSADISLNPWNLPQEDLEKLHHACKFMRENSLTATMKPLTKAFNKVLEIATTAAEEATAQSPARASSPIREGPLGRTAPKSQAVIIDPVPQALQDALMVAKQAVEDCVRLPSAPVTPKVDQEVSEQPMPSTSEQALASESADTWPVDENKVPDLRGFCNDMAELMTAVKAAKAELSSCSSGRCSEKSDGWTLINENYDEVKDLIINSDDSADQDIEAPERTEEPREFAPIYPPLNAATAVLDPNEADNAPAASAPPMPKVDDKPAPKTKLSPKAKPSPMTKPAAKATPIPDDPAAAQAGGAPYIQRSQLAPHVEAAVRQMESMGFSNQSGWLTQLLYHNDGNISTVLDLLTPSAANAK